MSNCCLDKSSASYPKKSNCPKSGHECGAVQSTTIKHHLKHPWLWEKKSQGYYFCADPGCPVIYFGEDGSIFEQSSLRTQVGVKQSGSDALLCYCFGVSKQDYLENTELIEFVKQETKSRSCACDVRNPSGRCCLIDF